MTGKQRHKWFRKKVLKPEQIAPLVVLIETALHSLQGADIEAGCQNPYAASAVRDLEDALWWASELAGHDFDELETSEEGRLSSHDASELPWNSALAAAEAKGTP